MQSIIDVNNVFFSYDDANVLENINFQVFDKDFVGIIGPNGGGKTTLIKLILGYLSPNQGEIKIFNNTPFLSRDKIGYVPQYLSYEKTFPISSLELVLMGSFSKSSFSPRINKEKINDAYATMSKLKIDHLANNAYSELSGGQKQRCLIARALINKPAILILDEPTSSVDMSVEKDIYDILHELNKDITILLISHDVSFISNYINKVICINKSMSINDVNNIDKVINEDYNKNSSQIIHKCGL